MTRLSQLGEFGFIDAIARVARSTNTRGVSVGIGDDAAVVACSPTTLLTTDTQREGVHFRLNWLSARQMGRRAFRVAVSDIAAMGGTPRYVLLSLGAPAGFDAGWGRRMVEGMAADARACGAALVGGNVSRDEKLSLVVTVVGEAVHRPVLRSGAAVGDAIWVTGPLGGAAAGVELLRRGLRRGSLISSYRTPPLRVSVASALAAAGLATAMIDVSDGLVQDLGHVCRASGVTARVDVDTVPLPPVLARTAKRAVRVARCTANGRRSARDRAFVVPARAGHSYALCGGDDYEIVFTTPERVSERAVRALCARHECKATRIGEMLTARREGEVVDGCGRRLDVAGYDHYGARS